MIKFLSDLTRSKNVMDSIKVDLDNYDSHWTQHITDLEFYKSFFLFPKPLEIKLLTPFETQPVPHKNPLGLHKGAILRPSQTF